MKLKMQREHYTTNDGGKTWTPKAAFESEEEIKEKNPSPDKTRPFHSYTCNVCGKLHIAGNYKDKDYNAKRK